MDGRRRLAESLTGGPGRRSAAVLAAGRRPRRIGRTGFDSHLRRVLGPLADWHPPRGIGVAAAALFLLSSVGFGVVRGGHGPEMMKSLTDLCDSAANAAGFRITTLSLAGKQQLTREQILAAAGITPNTSLLFLDAGSARARLKSNPWIAEATVLKLYPGRLHIAITERHAFALWQLDGKVSVIADDGTVLDRTLSGRFAHLPLVVGAGAATRAKEFLALLNRTPAIGKRTRAAVLVAERRWNLVLDNGIDVRLPEHNADQALQTLAKFDAEKNLLSRDITAIDLRLPDRLTVRLADDAYAVRQEALKAKQPKKKAGAA
jgi:cell division protein FtsQ